MEARLSKVPVIAIVDDDDSFRHATMSFIRSLGYAALQFSSAEAFLKSNRLHDADCLISDVQMPGMTGIELHRHLMASGKTIPTILITAYPDDSIRASAIQDGVVGYLSKPFDENDLLACLRLISDRG